ncbi:flagellar hook-length control protein FliK [uncultured Roseibium sp.]|uniref:flagellar hook-length control protein FliK n=1 Tax=uncultured Roseibium sp. TaxID=1936171 RepID=UPI003217E356
MVSAIAALQASLSSGTSSTQVRLEPGTETRARVEASLPGNVLRLSVGKSTIEVRANAALPAGTELTLKVSGDPGKPQIQLVPDGKGGAQASAGQGPSTDAATAQKLVQVAAKPGLPAPPTTSSSASATSVLGDAVTAAAAGKAQAVQAQATQTQATQTQATRAQTGQTQATQSSTQTNTAQSTAPQANAGQTGSGQANGAPATSAATAQAASSAAAQAVRQTVSQVVNQTVTQAPQTGTQTALQTPVAGGGSPAPAQTTGAPAGQAASTVPAPSPGAGAQAAVQASVPAGSPPVPPFSAQAPTLPGNLQLQIVPNSQAPTTTQGQPQAPVPGLGQAPVAQSVVSPAGQSATQTVQQPVNPSGQSPAAVPAGGQGSAASVPSGPGQVVSPQAPAGGQPPLAQGAPASPPQSVPASPMPTGGTPATHTTANPAATAQVGTPQGSAPLTGALAAGASSTSFTPVSSSGATAHFVNTLSDGSGRAHATLPGNAYAGSGRSPAGQTQVSPQNRPILPELKQASETVMPKLAEQQASLSGLYAQLSAVAGGKTAANVPQPVKQVMEQILGLRLQPEAAGFSGKSVEAAVKNSGLFREAALGGGQTGQAGAQGLAQGAGQGALGGDLKSLLVNLRSLLQGLGAQAAPGRPFTQPAAPSLRRSPQGDKPSSISSAVSDGDEKSVLNRLMRDTDAALSRIRMSQMVSRGLGGDEQAHHSRAMDLTMDLPIAVNGQTAIVQMQVGRDPEGAQGDEEDGPGWRLRFALDLTETGPMEAAVSLRGGGTYVSLWVDRSETLERLKADKDTLEASFAHAGIDLKELRFLRGLPQRTEARFGAVVDRQS